MKGIYRMGEGWRGRAGCAGRRGYGHWLVRVPPELVLEVGEGRVAGMMVSEGGEVRICALCVSSVAATKSAKDKGFSRVFIGVFIWAKVGRKELCRGGGSFWVSDERRDF